MSTQTQTQAQAKEIQTDQLQNEFSAGENLDECRTKYLNEVEMRCSALSEILKEFIGFNDLLADEYELEHDMSSALADIRRRSLEMLNARTPELKKLSSKPNLHSLLDKGKRNEEIYSV